MVVGWTRDGDTATIPPLLVQAIAAADVGEVLAEVAAGPPRHEVVDLAGPESLDLVDMTRRVLTARGDPLRLVASWRNGPFGTEMAGEVLLPGPGARLSTTTFDTLVGRHRAGLTAQRWLTPRSAGTGRTAGGRARSPARRVLAVACRRARRHRAPPTRRPPAHGGRRDPWATTTPAAPAHRGPRGSAQPARSPGRWGDPSGAEQERVLVQRLDVVVQEAGELLQPLAAPGTESLARLRTDEPTDRPPAVAARHPGGAGSRGRPRSTRGTRRTSRRHRPSRRARRASSASPWR